MSSHLLPVLAYLEAQGYDFITPTPKTHRRMSERGRVPGDDSLRDLFGWTRTLRPEDIDPHLLTLLTGSRVLDPAQEGCRLTVRAARVAGRLYLHSAPSRSDDDVFLGPDTYRYARFLRQALGPRAGAEVMLDIGVGAGVGALVMADRFPDADVFGSDVNSRALDFAWANALHNDVEIRLVECSGLPPEPRAFDVIAANPPYIAGARTRLYRDGGGERGEGLALEWAREALPRLTAGGQFLLYTGSAIVQGRDAIKEALFELAAQAGCRIDYEEIDPDVFGESLSQSAYQDVERIAAVGAVLTRP